MDRNVMLDAAVDYARRGWRVFPVHGIVEELGVLRCTCGAGVTCGAAGKHPVTTNGVKDATTREVTIAGWWRANPNWNVAIAMGNGSGIFGVDIDPRHGGMETMAEWCKEFGQLPLTLVAETGGNGYHYIYTFPLDDLPLPNRNGWLQGVDIKSEGGYFVAAPSRHISGGWYKWMNEDIAVGYASSALLESVRSKDWAGAGSAGSGDKATLPPDELPLLVGLPPGQRNDVLHAKAVQWLFKYRGDKQVVWLLVKVSAERVVGDDFTWDEVNKLWNSACRYYDEQQAKETRTQWEMTERFKEVGAPKARASAPVEPIAGVDLAKVAPDGFLLSDSGNAMRLIARYGDIIRSTPGRGWFVWDGSRWAHDIDNARVLQLASQTARAILHETVPLAHETGDDERVKRLLQWWRISDTMGKMRAMMGVAASEEDMIVDAPRWDCEDDLMNVVGGTLDLVSCELREARQDDLMTKTSYWSAPVAGASGEAAGCPGWKAFLDRVQPDPEVQDWLQKAVGYSMTGSVSEKCLFVLHGEGNNGKTVFLEVLAALFGDYASSASKSVFVGRREGQHPTDIAGMAGIRFVTCGEEIGPQDRFSETMIKSMTGGDTMRARFMKQDEFSFKFKGKLWLGTNHKPRIGDFSAGFRDRIRLIPWPVEIPVEERRNRDEFMSELIGEGPGILEWALEGLRRWRREGLGRIEAIESATRAYVEDEDVLGQFVADALVVDEGFTTNKELHDAYLGWWLMQGGDVKHALGAMMLGKQMRRFRVNPMRQAGTRGWNCRVTIEVNRWGQGS